MGGNHNGPKRKSLAECTRDLLGGASKKKAGINADLGDLEKDSDEETEYYDEDAFATQVKKRPCRPPSAKAVAKSKAQKAKAAKAKAKATVPNTEPKYKLCDEATRSCTRIRCSDGTSFSFAYSKYGGQARTLKMAEAWVKKHNK